MTKKFNRILSAVLAFVMVFAMGSFNVFAAADADTYTLTVSDKASGHDYNAYQIFKGNYSATDKNLSNVEWGTGVTVATTEGVDNSAQTAAEYIAKNFANSDPDAAYTGDEIVEYLAGIGVTISDTKTNLAYSTENKNYSASGVQVGYYLIKDDAASVPAGDAYTSYLVRLVGENKTVNVKKSTVSFDKKVQDVNDSNSAVDADGNWKDSADYDIGDMVPFKLKATLPSDFEDYDTYKLVFHDKEDAGLTFDSSTVKVFVGGTEVKSGFEVQTSPVDSDTFDVVINDVKSLKVNAEDSAPVAVTATSEIIVTYSSELNTNAIVGSVGNDNTAKLEYSNNPNSEGTGTTDEDKVTVFTFKLVVNKTKLVDGSDTETEPLDGAGFTLYKYMKQDGATNYDWAVIEEIRNGTTFTFTGLDDGRYKIEETKVPTGYNKADDLYFTVEAEHDTTAADPTLTGLTVTVTDQEGTPKKYEGTDNDVTLTVTSETLADGITTSEKAAFSTDVLNLKGSTLPETGGMGTKIFYTLGGILAVGAFILLVAKRRMKNV